jgi:c-di-GMP-binding flagellar brake protein YcgR
MDQAGREMSGKGFYQKISDLDLKELISFIDHNQTELVMKISDQFVKANVNHIKNDKFFSIFKFHNFDFSNEPVICCFHARDEIYFFRSYINTAKVEYTIDLPKEVFHLQRRNDFRVSMPIGLPHTCVIQYINGLQKNINVEMRDLSLGGCQLNAPAYETEVKTDDEIFIKLKIDRFEFGQLRLKARHCKLIKEQDSMLIGASFVDLDGENLSELRALLMFLDRKSRGKDSK